MSTDTFEDTLRDLLRDTADAAGPGYVEPDAAQVIGLGRRVVRRRRYATGLVAASVAGIAGVVGMAALGPGFDGASPPADTSSAAPSSPGLVTADLTRGTTTEPAGADSDEHTALVGVDLRQWELTTSHQDAEGGPTTTISHLPANPQTSAWADEPGSLGLGLGVVPAAAKDVVLVRAAGPATGPNDLQPLDGTPYQAFASWPEANDEQSPLTGLIWSDGSKVFDNQGVEVPSVRSESALGYVDTAQGVMGIFDGGVGTGPLKDSASGSVPSLMLTKEVVGSEEWDATVLLVLPPEVRTIKVKASPGTTVKSTVSDTGRPLSDDTLVLVRLTRLPRASGTGLDSVTWTNADGSQGSGAVGE